MPPVADHQWRTSSYSGSNGGQCVEVRFDVDSISIRDSKYRRDPNNDLAVEPVISVSVEAWSAFIAGVRAGEFDFPRLKQEQREAFWSRRGWRPDLPPDQRRGDRAGVDGYCDRTGGIPRVLTETDLLEVVSYYLMGLRPVPTPLQSQEEARTYLAQVFGSRRELQLHPFAHGWVVSPKPTETPIEQQRYLGQPKMVLDMRTRLILEFPSWPVQRVASEYSKAIETGAPPPGRQIYPPAPQPDRATSWMV